jgi:hypothetical protein
MARRSLSISLALLLAAAAAPALALAQQEPMGPAGGNVVISSPGRRDDAALDAVRQRLEQPLPARRGCATPEPTDEQIGAAAEAVLALRARREAAGEVPTAAGLRLSLQDKPPTIVQTYFHVVYPVKQADVEKTFPNGTYGGDGEYYVVVVGGCCCCWGSLFFGGWVFSPRAAKKNNAPSPHPPPHHHHHHDTPNPRLHRPPDGDPQRRLRRHGLPVQPHGHHAHGQP